MTRIEDEDAGMAYLKTDVLNLKQQWKQVVAIDHIL